jgi:hypothetical protein
VANKSVKGAPPPYVLTSKSLTKRKAKKRAKLEDPEEEEQVYEVDTYTLPYEGPYPSDKIRVNHIPFTPTQGSPQQKVFLIGSRSHQRRQPPRLNRHRRPSRNRKNRRSSPNNLKYIPQLPPPTNPPRHPLQRRAKPTL